MQRRIFVSIQQIQQALGSPAERDVLCLALMMKATFVSSVVYDASIRRLKSVFPVGTDHLRRILSDGISLGYFRWEIREGRKSLCVLPFSHPAGYYAPITVELAVHKENDVHCRYKLKNMERFLQAAVIANQARKIKDCSDTIRNAREGANVKIVRRAFRKCKRMLSSCPKSACVGLSNRRVQSLIHRGEQTARRVMNIIVRKKIAGREDHLVALPHLSAKTVGNGSRVNRYYDGPGYIMQRDGQVYLRLSDIYTYNEECGFISFRKA